MTDALVLPIMVSVLAWVPRWPVSLDPLIAEAKRRATQRRLITGLILLAIAAAAAAIALGLSGGRRGNPMGGLGSAARARRPASQADLRWMGSVPVAPAREGYVGVGWVSSARRNIGLVLLYPGRWLATVEPGSTAASHGELVWITPPTLLPTAAKPIAGYLVRRRWGVIAETLLRGPEVNKPQLANFCSVGRRVADALTAPYCGQAG